MKFQTPGAPRKEGFHGHLGLGNPSYKPLSRTVTEYIEPERSGSVETQLTLSNPLFSNIVSQEG